MKTQLRISVRFSLRRSMDVNSDASNMDVNSDASDSEASTGSYDKMMDVWLAHA